MEEKPKRLQKVAKFQIVKPVGNMTWPELGKRLHDVRYLLFRLGNMALSEAYLNFHKDCRMGSKVAGERLNITKLNKLLRQVLIEEGHFKESDLSRYSRDGALSGYVYGAFFKTKLRSVTNRSNWKKITKGEISLPVFKRDISIPIQSSGKGNCYLERIQSGDVEVDLQICCKPYPRVLLSTETLSGSQKTILERLLSNPESRPEGYRQRFFEIKEVKRANKSQLFLLVTYDFPESQAIKNNPDIIVGVDLGWSVPLYAAISNGHARLGWQKFKAIGDNIKALQRQTIARRRSIQRTGAKDISAPTARSGHGLKRKLLPTEKLQNRIDNAYTTLNHQLSWAVVEFAKNHGAGTIQVEDLKGLQEELKGTFLGQNWRRHQLQQFIKYKAQEAGIIVEEVNPRYTSRRCSDCGYIHIDFDYKFRQANRKNGKSTMFICPQCGYKDNADYNAARNLANADIEEKIRLQCEKQGIK